MVDIGSEFSAKVTRIEPYGVWLEHQGEKVLVLLPELSWQPEKNPADVVKVGESLHVKAIRYNYPQHTIVGSVRVLQPEKNPFRRLSLLAPDTRLPARVISLAGNTVTVALSDNIWGHLHMDIHSPQLHVGDKIEVVISSLEVDDGRLVVSLVQQDQLAGSSSLVSAS